MKSADLAFAEFLDLCCGRYARSLPYRRRLELERPLPPPHPMSQTSAAPSHDTETRRSA